MYQSVGAHISRNDAQPGVNFAVWAPNAQEVCVVTDGNGWQHGCDWLGSNDDGIWRGFIPNAQHGTAYKYSLKTDSGMIQKADPFAFRAELPPKTASIVCDLDRYEWGDAAWMTQRRETDWLKAPMSVYEVHLASWKRPWDDRTYHSYEELAEQLVDYVKSHGFTHIELMPMTEFPFDGSWGYQVTGYFAPTSRFGEPDGFRHLIDHCHQNGIGVIVDWVPAHFPNDAHGLAMFDGTALYEHEDVRKGFHPDWNTHIFNFGRSEVREFLISSARFWMDQYHIDGIRVDAVASMLYLDYSREEGEWIPNEFGGRENLEAIQLLKDLNVVLHREFPGAVTIAEESTSWPGVSKPVYAGGLGFTMKWDMGWMHDTLKYIERDPIHRSWHQDELSFRSHYQLHENFVLPLSHDEVVHGKGSIIDKMPGDEWQKFANLRLLYGYQWTMPGKKLLFMGCEFGQLKEWDHDEQLQWELKSKPLHDGVGRFIGDLNRLYRDYPALHELDYEKGGYSWIHADDAANSVYSYERSASDGQKLVVALNFTPEPKFDYQIGVSQAGDFIEVLNSDAKIYGGSNVGNLGKVASKPVPKHGRKFSLKLNLPPLAMVIVTIAGPQS